MKKPKPQFKKPSYRRLQVPLDMKERDSLIAMLNGPVFQKVLANISAMKPDHFPEGRITGTSANKDVEVALHVVNNRMHVIQGWELFEAALVVQTAEPTPKKQPIPDNFPDSGRIDHE